MALVRTPGAKNTRRGVRFVKRSTATMCKRGLGLFGRAGRVLVGRQCSGTAQSWGRLQIGGGHIG